MYLSTPEFEDTALKLERTTLKKYICVGGKYRCAKTKNYIRMPVRQLPRLYKIDPNECIFFKDENRFANINHRMIKMNEYTIHPNYYVLRPRKNGDYENHIAERKAARLLEDKPI